MDIVTYATPEQVNSLPTDTELEAMFKNMLVHYSMFRFRIIEPTTDEVKALSQVADKLRQVELFMLNIYNYNRR